MSVLPPGHALMVYGPETLQSSLTAMLDHFVAQATGLVASERFLAVHDDISITQFYELTGSTKGPHWPLVVDLFDGRPCLVTVWRGLNALPELQRIKGATQPCLAASETVRSRFWCDNPVCNLVHVSDSSDIARSEWALLQSRRISDVDGLRLSQGPCSTARHLRHSALWQFAEWLGASGADPLLAPRPPASMAQGSVLESALAAIHAILRAHTAAPPWLQEAIAGYLHGERVSLEVIKHHLRRPSAWQRMIIECGLSSNPIWMKRLNIDAETPWPNLSEMVGP